MSERELTQHFGTRVEIPPVTIDQQVLKATLAGIAKQIVNERFPDRIKRLKAIRNDIKKLVKAYD